MSLFMGKGVSKRTQCGTVTHRSKYIVDCRRPRPANNDLLGSSAPRESPAQSPELQSLYADSAQSTTESSIGTTLSQVPMDTWH